MQKLHGTLRRKNARGPFYYRLTVANGVRKEFALKTTDELEEKHENRSETSKSGSAHSTSRLPWLFPLTAEKLFEMARRQPDPAREMFGYFYEAELRKECQHLIEYPLDAGDFYNLLYCHKLLVANGQYFKCAAAIQPILQNYLNAMEEYENEGRV